MTGITGRLVTAPHSTSTGGRINSRLKWYSPSSADDFGHFSGVATLPTAPVWLAIRYTTAVRDEARQRRVHQMPDMAVEIGIRNDSREVRRIGQRRNFVAEVGAGHRRAQPRRPAARLNRRPRPSAPRPRCRLPPRGAGAHRDHAGDEERGNQNILRTDQLQPQYTM